MSEHLVPIILFISFAAIIIGLLYYRHKIKAKQQQTIQKLIEKEQQLTPELIAAIGKKSESEHSDLSRGVVLIAFAVAIVLYGTIALYDDPEFAALGVFPFAIGIAYLVINKVKKQAKL